MFFRFSLLLAALNVSDRSLALQCYNTCFEDCVALECLANNGNSLCRNRIINEENVTLPGYILQTCADPNDSCLMREFNAVTLGTDLLDELALITTPGGCLSEFKIDFTNFQYWKRSSTKLYSCDSDRCNIPSVDICIDNKKCRLKAGDFRDVFKNVVRGGGDEQLGKGERCILDSFVQINETSSCLEEGCATADETLGESDFISCTECEEAVNCNVTEPTPAPAEIVITNFPTSQPSLSSGGIQCYNTCFEDCSAEKCLKENGKSLCKTRTIIDRDILFPGYIIETCPDENDVCLQREFLAAGIDGPALMTVPGGCLSQFKLDSTPFDYWDRSSTQLYTCDSNRCNEPPVPRCVNKKQCSVQEAETRDMFLNIVRGGGDEQLGKGERCIESPFTQISETSNCLFVSFPNCSNAEDNAVDSREFVSCDNCSAAFNCNESQPTPAPSDLKFSAEEKNQTLITATSTGLGALAILAVAFACYTKRNEYNRRRSQKLFDNAPIAVVVNEDLETRQNLNEIDASPEPSFAPTYEVESPYAAHDPELDDPIKGTYVSSNEEEDQIIRADMVEMLSI